MRCVPACSSPAPIPGSARRSSPPAWRGAWDASYWKPLQTGLAEEAGDTDTVVRLACLPPERVPQPAYALQAPLSPEAAAALEGVVIDPAAITLPDIQPGPLVVEGAGGLMVPIGGGLLMIDLIRRLALPVVLVARGTLGTINHTLLSLEALRARGIAVAGVVFNRGCTPANRAAIERHGRVRILAELPDVGSPDADAIARLARSVPPFCSLHEGGPGSSGAEELRLESAGKGLCPLSPIEGGAFEIAFLPQRYNDG